MHKSLRLYNEKQLERRDGVTRISDLLRGFALAVVISLCTLCLGRRGYG